MQDGATTSRGGAIITATADYRRQARRIRASFADQPLLRHYALTELARRQPAVSVAQRPAVGPVERPAVTPPAVAETPFRMRAIRTSVRVPPPMSPPMVVARYLPTEPGTTTSAVERGFADHAADRIRSGPFTFSDRAYLLDMAAKLGIPRFRANLILALERNRIDPASAITDAMPSRSAGWLPNILTIVAVEAAVVGLFVWACTL